MKWYFFGTRAHEMKFMKIYSDKMRIFRGEKNFLSDLCEFE